MTSQLPATISRTAWGVCVLASRLPVAMTPLTLVFLGIMVYDSYTYGLALVGLYAASEACFAPVLGMRLSGSYFRREVAIGLLLSSGAYGLLAALGAGGAPLAWCLAILAGAGAAAVPGALRVAIMNIINRDRVRQAFSVETVITMASWAAAPAIVAFASFRYSPLLVVTGCCLLMIVSLVVVGALPEGDSSLQGQPEDSTARKLRIRRLVKAWPIFLSAALAMSVVSFVELLLPALLDERGSDPSYSGPLLTVIAVASIVGAVLYGVLKIPGSHAVQSWVSIGVMLGAVGLIALIATLPYFITLLCVLGLGQSVCIVARNLSLREHLPLEEHITGFAVLYSLSGVGYGLSAGISALALSLVSAHATILIGVTCIVVVCAVIGIVQIATRDAQSAL